MKEEYLMLSVEEALERVLSAFQPLPSERIPVLETLGRVITEDVFADMDVPPLANSAMDGYAVRAADTAEASRENPVRLRIIDSLTAGRTTQTSVTAGCSIRIMTGVPIPSGADAVVQFENTDQGSDWVKIFKGVETGTNVREAGEDVKKGGVILSRGTEIRPQEVGMLAALGRKDAWVHRRPRVAILATGDELIEIDAPWSPGKIRNSNSYSITAQVIRYGALPLMLGIAPDNEGELTAKIREGLEKGADLFLTSGGVSMGDFDMVKKVLATEGKMGFWRVRMKPGKPLAFGQIEGVPLLGLPGNPVSAMVTFELFARPAILKMQGKTRLEKPIIEATLGDAIPRKDDRRHYVRVIVERQNSEYKARLTGDQGSGILLSMVRSQGLAIIPEDVRHLPAGTKVPVMMLDWPEDK
ncbi:MAG: molybdopterin molybdenumtransferase MoeA [Deltaproteobacteria bacterium]|nr:MAG: molybdopterin molybdenumtransferase MoeA [Deltaproteobacteria bacterium]